MKQEFAAIGSVGDSAHATDKQLAKHRGVSRRTIHEWKERGWIPFYKIGKCLRFCIQDVDAALRERFEVRAKPPQK